MAVDNRRKKSSVAVGAILGEKYQVDHIVGQGGMGIVNLARQRAMAREVAVKRVLPERKGAESELLIEARVMGNLEHPNVVPVHALGVDEVGDPLIVMKRITGTVWRHYIEHPEAIEDLDEARDFYEHVLGLPIGVATR